jgi:hypothetical protein
MDTTEPRYTVEQLGYRDYGVWDSQDERWVLEGDRDDCDDKAEHLNKERP